MTVSRTPRISQARYLSLLLVDWFGKCIWVTPYLLFVSIGLLQKKSKQRMGLIYILLWKKLPSVTSRYILVRFQWHGCSKKCAQESSCNKFFIIISDKILMKYGTRILKSQTFFNRHKYSSPNALNIKYFWTFNYNHCGVLGITKLSDS